jgi:hypothetical protein
MLFGMRLGLCLRLLLLELGVFSGVSGILCKRVEV